MDWYALFVETGKEVVVQRAIADAIKRTAAPFACKTLVPIVERVERNDGVNSTHWDTMFPGYVLCSTDDVATLADAVKRIRYTYHILGEDGKHAPIALEEIASIVTWLTMTATLGSRRYSLRMTMSVLCPVR